MLQLLYVVIVLLVTAEVVRRTRRWGAQTAAEVVAAEDGDSRDPIDNPYHCVTCTCRNEGCAAAAKMAGKRYLVGRDRHLPMPECTAFNCRCQYVHYPDRRHLQEDRRASFGLEQDMYEFTHGHDRRSSAGRRAEDWESVDQWSVAS